MMILYDSLTSFDYVNNFFELHHLVRSIILDQYFVRVNIELLFLRPRPHPTLIAITAIISGRFDWSITRITESLAIKLGEG